jgi:septation ring formation regulator EzrA
MPGGGQPATPSRPADFTDTNIRLVQLKGQATRFRSTISRMQSPYGTARLDEPMSNLSRLLRQAESAMNAGDTTAARRYMDQADNEVTKLKELLDQ